MSRETNEGRTKGVKIEEDNPQKTEVPKGKNYLFVIGIDKYQKCPPLFNAVKDAQDVANLLIEKYQYSKENLVSLFNEEATAKNIVNQFRYYIKNVSSDDTLLVYFSGHGEYDEDYDEGSWIPVEGIIDDISTFISFDRINKSVKQIKSQHTFIIADSCYSGTMFTERSLDKVYNRLERVPSRWLLTAGRNEVVMDGKPGDNSPFADSVLFWLKDNRDPRFRVSKFCMSVEEDVSKNASQQPRWSSLKNVGDRGGEFMFRLKDYVNTVFEEAEETVEEAGTVRAVTEQPKRNEPVEVVRKPITNLEELQDQLIDYIGQVKFEAVFDLLDQFLVSRGRTANNLVMIKGRYNSAIQNEETTRADDHRIAMARIRKAALNLANGLEEEDIRPNAFDAHSVSNIVGVTRAGSNFASKLSDAEREGLEQQAQILQEKINYFRSQLFLISDFSQKFTLQKQLEAAEKEMAEIKGKLGL